VRRVGVAPITREHFPFHADAAQSAHIVLDDAAGASFCGIVFDDVVLERL
jgi:hypothetical protein